MINPSTAYIVHDLERTLSPVGGLDWLRGKSCLDVGCGSGLYAVALTFFEATSVIGIDNNEESVKFARSIWVQLRNLEFLVATVEHLPFVARSCDLVLCLRVLHHMSDTSAELKELNRVLKVDGILCGVESTHA